MSKKLKLVRAIDPYTFKLRLGVMDGDKELGIIGSSKSDDYFYDFEKGTDDPPYTVKVVKTAIKDMLEDPSRDEEVEVFIERELNRKTPLSLNMYQEKAIETAIYGAGAKITYPTLGLVGEAGEVANKVKKVIRDNDGVFTDEKKTEIAKEIGDTLWYIAALANDLGYSLEELAQDNLDKLASRKARNVIGGSGDNR